MIGKSRFIPYNVEIDCLKKVFPLHLQQDIKYYSMKLSAIVNEERNTQVGLNTYYRSKFSNNSPLCLINNSSVHKIEFSQKVPRQNIQIGLYTKMRYFQMNTPSILFLDSIETALIRPISSLTLNLAQHSGRQQIVQIITHELRDQLMAQNLIINNKNHFRFTFKETILEIHPLIYDGTDYGIIGEETNITFRKQPQQKIEIIEDNPQMESLFKNYQSKAKHLKVGGVREQLQLIERRIFSMRMLHPRMMKKLGIKHIKGMLLYGPPGTGKTLIAREISKILKFKPKIVNGPEILSEFVGKSEETIRGLFQDAVKGQRENGPNSDLHCIIFDQIDAICKKRGSQTSNGVYDLVVNQLLTCIDGVESLNNILVIGITNRKDLIDPAILRPGRLEVQIEINLPDEEGREEILRLHTELMRTNGFLDDTVNIKELASLTKNFTGAQLEGAVKSAQSYALESWKKIPPVTGQNYERYKVTQADFLKGVKQITPQFGKDNSRLETIIPKNKIRIEKYYKIKERITNAIDSLQDGKHTFLLRGDVGTGKTILALECALANNSVFVKHISCDSLVGMNEGQIITELVSTFEDSEKSDSSLIVLDDIFRLIEFVPLGPRFNANILNVMINLIKRSINPTKKQIIIATASRDHFFEDLGLTKYFKYVFALEKLNTEEIGSALGQLGFDEPSSVKIARHIKSSSVSEIASVTRIQKTRDSDKWISCWDEIKQGLN